MGIRVFIADQERAFAEALAARLGDEEDITVVGAVEARTQGSWLVAAKSVDILVVDCDLPDAAVNPLYAEISGSTGSSRVVALSVSSEPERIVTAVRAGAAAWVRKDQSLEYLLRVIRGVVRGETWLPPSETGKVMRLLLREQEQRQHTERLLASLTSRERVVLARLAEGAGNPEGIAKQLHLSTHTVRTHLRNVMAKLGVHSALEAVALAREQWRALSEGSRSPW